MNEIEELQPLKDAKKSALYERLFDLMPDDLYEVIDGFPTAALVLIERWYRSEYNRLTPLMRKDQYDYHDSSPSIKALIELASSDEIDLQHIEQWLSGNRQSLTAQQLVELVSASMAQGVVQLMSAKGKTKRKNKSKQLEQIGIRWLQLSAIGKNKTQVAEQLAEEFHLTPRTVYKHLTGAIEKDPRLFPHGIDAAKQSIGLQ